MKSIIAVAVAVVASFSFATAQDLKFAHIDTQKLLSELPERAEAEKTLTSEAQKLEEQLQVMNNELQAKYEDYMSKRDSLPDLIKATREKEIQDAGQRIQSYQQMAQQSLSQKEQQLMMPILEKVQNAITAVGQENGFIYIFDISTQVVLYHSDKSVDAAPLVKAKLGIQ